MYLFDILSKKFGEVWFKNPVGSYYGLLPQMRHYLTDYDKI